MILTAQAIAPASKRCTSSAVKPSALLVLAEWLTGEGIYLDDIINGVWCICEESSWVLPAHHNSFYQDGVRRGLPKIDEQVIDLFAAETGALLAWTWALVGKTLEHAAPEVNERILLELKRRITEPYIRRDDFWWMGLRKPITHWLIGSPGLRKLPASCSYDRAQRGTTLVGAL